MWYNCTTSATESKVCLFRSVLTGTMHIFMTLIYIMLSLKNDSISYRKDSSMKALCASVLSISTQGWTGSYSTESLCHLLLHFYSKHHTPYSWHSCTNTACWVMPTGCALGVCVKNLQSAWDKVFWASWPELPSLFIRVMYPLKSDVFFFFPLHCLFTPDIN